VCAAYGIGMLICVTIGMSNVIQSNVDVYKLLVTRSRSLELVIYWLSDSASLYMWP
jgi:hypothetical protein